jgi:hypothetical protein
VIPVEAKIRAVKTSATDEVFFSIITTRQAIRRGS